VITPAPSGANGGGSPSKSPAGGRPAEDRVEGGGGCEDDRDRKRRPPAHRERQRQQQAAHDVDRRAADLVAEPDLEEQHGGEPDGDQHVEPARVEMKTFDASAGRAARPPPHG
jgi:hypothetical protein